MNGLKNAMWWMRFFGILVGFGLCGIGLPMIDGQIQHDAASDARLGLVHAFGVSLAICAVIWTAAWLAYRMARLLWENDPDIGSDDDANYEFAPDSFPSSPTKPR